MWFCVFPSNTDNFLRYIWPLDKNLNRVGREIMARRDTQHVSEVWEVGPHHQIQFNIISRKTSRDRVIIYIYMCVCVRVCVKQLLMNLFVCSLKWVTLKRPNLCQINDLDLCESIQHLNHWATKMQVCQIRHIFYDEFCLKTWLKYSSVIIWISH